MFLEEEGETKTESRQACPAICVSPHDCLWCCYVGSRTECRVSRGTGRHSTCRLPSIPQSRETGRYGRADGLGAGHTKASCFTRHASLLFWREVPVPSCFSKSAHSARQAWAFQNDASLHWKLLAFGSKEMIWQKPKRCVSMS